MRWKDNRLKFFNLKNRNGKGKIVGKEERLV
jgi:hypothetical protein